MLQDGLDASKCLDDVRTVSVQIPKLAIMTLARPPEWVALHVLIDLKLHAGPEALVKAQGTPILLEQGVDSGQTAIPAVFQIFERETTVLLVGFEALLRVFRPHTLRVDELGFPGDDVPEDVRNQGLFVPMASHTGAVMRDACICLL